MTATEDTELRRRVDDLLRDIQPPAVPIDRIVRRGRAIRLRRAGAAVIGLGLAGIVAVTTLHGGRQPVSPATVPSGPLAPGGVIASGTAHGHAWRLAVQDIADPGYRCLPAITLNGTDADPVYPDPGDAAAMTVGPAFPGVGFGFIQLPASIREVIINGRRHVPAVVVAACGYRYYVAGFAYSLAQALHVTVANPPPGWPPVFPIAQPLPPGLAQETDGLWVNAYSTRSESASGLVASGHLSGEAWSIRVVFGVGGDCYAFNGGGSQMGWCGPVGTPDGAETIVALPLGFPNGTGATGYGLEVSPATAHLRVLFSNGTSELATPRVIDGRKYAAFIVPDPLSLSRLTWLDAAGRVIASIPALPPYGDLQFQP
jgi:hypothetical protein